MTVEDERSVQLALVLPDGTPLGMTPAFAVGVDYWWRGTEELVAAASSVLGVRPVILRLVSVTPGEPERLVHVAEVASSPSVALEPFDDALLADEPLRMPWARPGGPDRYLDWARSEIRLTGDPIQVRTWNLSTLWRLPTTDGDAWLKAVPPFFAHEGAVLERLRDFPVPQLIARCGDAMLMAGIPGDDRYDAPVHVAMRMVDLLVGVQTAVDVTTLPPTPRWAPASLAPLAERTLRLAPDVSAEDRRTLSRLIDGLPDLQAALDAAGLPDTLIHGDFHPGNVRGDDDHLVLLDWGDSGIGHPLLDLAAFTERMPASSAAQVTAHWLGAWQRAVPGSDPARALELIGPYAALRQATLYRAFLDRIEPSEHVYHHDDPAIWLGRAAALAR